jgi:hypothetical protein
MVNPDKAALKGSIEGYLGRSSEIFDQEFLDLAESELAGLRKDKGFSFPTNEGMRKITKEPETRKIDDDPVLSRLSGNIRKTIKGVGSNKEGGVYAGVNGFHHGHLAFLSKSEAIVAADMNKIVPYGFSFIVGTVGAIKTPEDFREQISLMAADPKKFKEFFSNTGLEGSILVSGGSPAAELARQRLLKGFIDTMNEFDPQIHGQDKIPPVFCWDKDAYDYFRMLVLQDKVAGAKAKLQGYGFMDLLSRSLDAFNLDRKELNTFYASSCFDPRFLGPKERSKFLKKLSDNGMTDYQVVESFLNSGWIVYDIKEGH